jgi:hypothetical protein
MDLNVYKLNNDFKEPVSTKNWLSSVVSKFSNIASLEYGVVYTETCRELCETWYIVFFSVRVGWNNTNYIYTYTVWTTSSMLYYTCKYKFHGFGKSIHDVW